MAKNPQETSTSPRTQQDPHWPRNSKRPRRDLGPNRIHIGQGTPGDPDETSDPIEFPRGQGTPRDPGETMGPIGFPCGQGTPRDPDETMDPIGFPHGHGTRHAAATAAAQQYNSSSIGGTTAVARQQTRGREEWKGSFESQASQASSQQSIAPAQHSSRAAE